MTCNCCMHLTDFELISHHVKHFFSVTISAYFLVICEIFITNKPLSGIYIATKRQVQKINFICLLINNVTGNFCSHKPVDCYIALLTIYSIQNSTCRQNKQSYMVGN